MLIEISYWAKSSLAPWPLLIALFQTARWIAINYGSIAGCSLGIGDQRILCQLCRILWLKCSLAYD